MDSVSNIYHSIQLYILIGMIISEIISISFYIYSNYVATEIHGWDFLGVVYFMYFSSTPAFIILSIVIYIISFVWKMKKYYCFRLALRTLNLIPLIIASVVTIDVKKSLPYIAPIIYVYVIFLEFLYNRLITKEEETKKIKNDYNSFNSASINFI